MMKHTLIVTVVLVLALSACGSNTAAPTAAPDTRAAQLSEIKNTVESRAAVEGTWSAVSEGATLASGAGVRTGESGGVRVDISDGTILRLAPNSLFELKALSPEATDPVTQWSLEVGQVWIAVTKNLGAGTFEVSTPNGVATVRGSFMGVEYHPANGHMIITCLEGACRLTQPTTGDFTDLVAGQQTGIRGFGNKPLPPRTIDVLRLGEWAQSFPEALPLVGTITPGPAPSATPVFTPAP